MILSARIPPLDDTASVTFSNIKGNLALSAPLPPIPQPSAQIFSVSKLLYQLLHQVDNSIKPKTVYHYHEIVNLLLSFIRMQASKYLLSGSEVIYCKNEPLGKVFETNHIHRCQLDTFLQRKLKPPHLLGNCMTANGKCLVHTHYIPPPCMT